MCGPCAFAFQTGIKEAGEAIAVSLAHKAPGNRRVSKKTLGLILGSLILGASGESLLRADPVPNTLTVPTELGDSAWREYFEGACLKDPK